ncbi:MAG: hypothetical protein H6765_05440 [Candidatus Peribacteria bacterium]|nr:MAG: hypothetical protein H6765_05440 [Candidatus Peribacteria bacterium]
MKKIAVLVLCLFSVSLLTGCSLDSLKQRYDALLGSAVQKDAEHQQGFTDLTQEQVYEKFVRKTKGIDLSTMNLAKVPDLCSLVKPEDHLEVWNISLANNNIKVVDADLSCFKFLQTLNLSYNDIQTIVSLGDLPMLKSLSLKKNQLETTDNLPELPSLEVLSM